MSKTTTTRPRFFVVIDEFAKELTNQARPSRDRRHSYQVREPLYTYSANDEGDLVCSGLATLENGEVDMLETTERMETLYRSRKVNSEVIECATKHEMNEKADILKRKLGRRGRVSTRRVLPGLSSDLAAINQMIAKGTRTRTHA